MLFRLLLVLSLLASISGLIPSTRSFVRVSKGSLIQPRTPQVQQPVMMSISSIPALASSIPLRNVLAVPVMYFLMSINEYITHRYYQHAEYNKNEILKKITCFFMGLENAPKIKGGGHVEHHAETYDDMTLKTDARWRETPAAKSLNADKYRGTGFTWTVLGLMTLQMMPTAIPVFKLMGFSILTTLKMVAPAILLHGLIWNALHPAMHGLEDVPVKHGPPSTVFGKFTNTPYFKYLYKNHQGHHVAGGQGNYNVCCPGTDHLVGSFIPESVWKPMMREKRVIDDVVLA